MFIVASLTLALDPAFTETIEIYHVNSKHYGTAPINMDTANIAGDAFFDLRSVAMPLECADKSTSHPVIAFITKLQDLLCVNPNIVYVARALTAQTLK